MVAGRGRSATNLSAMALWERLRRRGTDDSLAEEPVEGGTREEQLVRAGDDSRPVLAVDVDGVISLFAFEGPLVEAPGEMHLIDGVAHCISRAAGERLIRLAQ